jgi:hypothetical protein
MSRPTIPEEIVEVEASLGDVRSILSLTCLSEETRKELEGEAAHHEGRLRVLRREFEANRKALEAAGGHPSTLTAALQRVADRGIAAMF